MLTKHFSGTIAVIFIAPVLLGGGLISLPAMQKVEGSSKCRTNRYPN